MAKATASTQFITTQKSGLAVKDVYDGQSSEKEVLNIGSKVGVGKLDTDTATKAMIDPKSLRGRFQEYNEKIRKATSDKRLGSIDTALDKVRNAVGNKESIINDLKGGLLTDVLTGLGYKDDASIVAGMIIGEKDPLKILGGLGQLDPNIGVVIDGINTIINAKDLDSVTGIADVLQQLTGNTDLIKVLQLENEAALLGGVLEKAIRLRVPTIVDVILDTVKERKTRQRLLIQSVPVIAHNSDLVTLRKVANLIGWRGIYATYPMVIHWLLANYRTTGGTSPTKMDAKEFIDILIALKPDWWLTKRGDDNVLNFEMMVQVSEHAKIALSYKEDLRTLSALANQYKNRGFRDILNTTRPWIKFPAM